MKGQHVQGAGLFCGTGGMMISGKSMFLESGPGNTILGYSDVSGVAGKRNINEKINSHICC